MVSASHSLILAVALAGTSGAPAPAPATTSQADKLFLIDNQLTDVALPILVEIVEAGALPCIACTSTFAFSVGKSV